MELTKIRLGDYIQRSTVNNRNLQYGEDLIAGVNNTGVFTTHKGSTNGVNIKPYKIVETGAFVYNPTRLDLGSIAYRTEGLCIVSHLYKVFYLTDEGKKIIDPQWLFIYFRRKEFQREVTFRNFCPLAICCSFLYYSSFRSVSFAYPPQGAVGQES